MATQKLQLTRDQLATFLKSHEQIRQFERLFAVVDQGAGGGDLSAIQGQLDRLVSAPAHRESDSMAQDAVDFVGHYKPAHIEGRLFYDYADHCLAYYNEDSGVTVSLGRGEELVRVYNSTGTTLLNGQIVYIISALSGWPTVELAQADTRARSQSTLGMVTADIDPGSHGYVCASGIVNDLNTTAYAPGDVIYLSPDVPGAWSATPPLQPNYVVEIGTVIFPDAVAGRVLISIDKKPWFPSAEILDTSASITLPTIPAVFKPGTLAMAQGFQYSAATGIVTVENSGSYAITIQFNAQPSASNKNIYFYIEESTDGGASWQIARYSGRQLELVNSVQTQVNVTAARYYAEGTMLRFYIWGDSTVSLKTSDLPGTTPGTASRPAYRFLIA